MKRTDRSCSQRLAHCLGLLAIAALPSLPLAATEKDAERLGTTLTPNGGERAAGAAVPAWEGADQPTAGWAFGKLREAHWQHRAEKPLFSIDAASADKHADKLSPGQLQMLKRNPGYRMDVYPGHRNCTAPDWVNANTRRNVTQARLTDDGNALAKAVLPGVPFPIPASGAEAMWNFQTYYKGVGVDWASNFTLVSPREAGANWINVEGAVHIAFPWASHGAHTVEEQNGLMYGYYFGARSPAASAGQALVARNSFGDKENEVYYYFPGQRRVRRLPSYGYDAPQIGFENQYTIDETLMFQGLLTRFDWKLVGKKEIYVPYNTFRQLDFNAKREAVYQDKFINADYRRYEAHRVWVVEATVKKGMRHNAPRKLFYIDEDSWIILVGEDYDAQGELWKMREATLIPAWELGSACVSSSFVQYDLIQKRYLADFVTVGAGKDVRWLPETSDKRFKVDFFTSDSLRAISER
nr:DUF1329 domain-containing protein [uncultured Roseateles sp.]